MAGLVEGKVALVTGGGLGIGRAAALAFAREGARVVIADVDAPAGEATAQDVRGRGGEASFFRTDVSDEAQVEALVHHCAERFGALDCALNNAGVMCASVPIHDAELADWQRTLAVNLTGVFLCLKHELRRMRAQGSGAIVNVSSGAGLIAVPALAPYCASKHGILGLTKTAAAENARSGIRVNALCPGAIDTPMLRASLEGSPEVQAMVAKSQPFGRLGRAEEVAEAAVWLCSERASFVSGESMLVDGASVAR